jgi:hypothetical protein
MMISQFLLPLFTIFIILDFDGYERYNASIIAADETATTYYLACAPQ